MWKNICGVHVANDKAWELHLNGIHPSKASSVSLVAPEFLVIFIGSVKSLTAIEILQ